MSAGERAGGQQTIYYLDDRDVIVDVNSAWNDFASSNGGILLANDVVGQSLFRFVTGEPTRMYLNVLLESVRTLKRDVVRAYRCDSPQIKRFMEMSVRAAPDGRLQLEHRCLRQESQGANVTLNYRPGVGAVRCCSICNRVEKNGTWIEAVQAIAGSPTGVLDVAYHVCGNCMSETQDRRVRF